MEKLRLLMVDSDPIIRFNLLELLNMHNCFRLEAELETTEEALDHILTHEVDVVFINCQPADPSRTSQGTCLPLMLESKYPDIQVIAYSGSPEDAYSAVRNGCSGFFTLPAEPVDLHRIVNRLCYIYQLQRLRDETAHSSLMIKTRSGYDMLQVRQILFLERIGRSCRIHMEDGRQVELVGYSMAELERMLKKRGFFRCHQSFLVNLAKVAMIQSDNDSKHYAVRFVGLDGEIAVSREKYMEMLTLLREKYGRLER
jgi:DNA-binding LytR/AlgR family response regulator